MRDGAAIVARLGGRRYPKGWMFRCPVHDDRTPSCSLRSKDGLLTCFAGCPRDQVAAALDALGFTDDGAAPDQVRNGKEDDDRIAYACSLWEQSKVGNPAVAEKYLRCRGITLPVPEVLRPPLIVDVGHRLPLVGFSGIIAAVAQLDGTITAVQNKGRGYSINYGRLLQGAVQLTAPTDGELGLAEGIETALSATQLTGVPCWATLGANRLDVIELPDSIRRVHLFADNDDAGRDAVARATARYHHVGLRLRRWWPPDQYKDWNDVLMVRRQP